ncbi:MAG TPA: outer membrane beta-barrel protein [Geomonas sp.]|nr:outer membrane beta-barrel protein [Geomonas sp.]
MKITWLLAGLLVAASATSAMAAGTYVGASVGPSFFHDSDISESGFPSATASYDTGFVFNVGAGHKFDSGVRLEGEFGYKKADLSSASLLGITVSPTDSDQRVMSFMFNGFYDFNLNSSFTPFLGAGVGALHGKVTSSSEDFEDTVFGYQVSAGVSYSASKNVNLDLSYRFEGAATDFDMGGSDVSYHSSNILVGVRYTF